MGWHGSYKPRKFEVGERLLALRTRTKLTQAELATRINASRRTVQSWEAGAAYPQEEKLQLLISLFLAEGALTAGQEYEEAVSLWQLVNQDAPRRLARFDEAWFASLISDLNTHARMSSIAHNDPASANPVPSKELVSSLFDWGEAIDVPLLYGREAELATLCQWVIDDRCRVVALLGLGGIGKTSLAVALAREANREFDIMLFRSLRNAPSLELLLDDLIQLIANQQIPQSGRLDDKIFQVVQFLRQRRCLLILDNLETILEAQTGNYRTGYTDYGRIIQQLGEVAHQSCLLLTSREKPMELVPLEGRGAPVRTLLLSGLADDAGKMLLQDKDVFGTDADYLVLMRLYGGNPLALKLISEPIREVFGGDISTFLLRGHTFFNSVGELLDQHFNRSTPVEQAILYWLALAREWVPLDTILEYLTGVAFPRDIMGALESLRRRFLIERGEGRPAFTLQPVIMEYVTDRLVEEVCQEILSGQIALLQSHALIQATAKDYIRHSQERLIGTVLLQHLTSSLRSQAAVGQRLLLLLDKWRARPIQEQGFGPGNVVNLLRLLQNDLRGLDLSRLAILEAFLQGVEMQDARLREAHLSRCALQNAFGIPATVALSSDGTYLAAGTMNGLVHVWSAINRTLVLSVQESSSILGVAISADGGFLIIGSEDGTAQLWNVVTGTRLAILEKYKDALRCVAVSTDGKMVAIGDVGGKVRLWNVATSQLAAELIGHASEIRCVTLSVDGQFAASGSVDGIVRIWETASHTCLAILEGHTALVQNIALSTDGALAVSGSFDGTVRLWSLTDSHLIAVLQGHSGGVRSMTLSDDGRLIASGGVDGTIRIWESMSQECIAVIRGHSGAIYGISASADGQIIASASADGTVRLWDVPNRACIAVMQGHSSSLYSVTLNNEQQVIASGGADGIVRLWALKHGQLLATLRGHISGIYGIALSADGNLLASGSFDETVKLWSCSTGQLILTIEAQAEGIRCLALSGDGQLLVTGGGDGLVRFWDTEDGRCLRILEGHTSANFGVAVAADGRLVASGSVDGTIKLWSTDNGSCLATLPVDATGVYGVALSADAAWAVCGSFDGTITLWSIQEQRRRATLKGHTGSVRCVAASNDGSVVVSGGYDGTVRLWNVESGRSVTVTTHAAIVWSIAFSNDGNYIVSASDDGTIQVSIGHQDGLIQTLHVDRLYERMDITDLTGVTEAERGTLLAMGAVEQDAK